MPDDSALTHTAEALQIAEHSEGDFPLGSAQLTRGITPIPSLGLSRRIRDGRFAR